MTAETDLLPLPNVWKYDGLGKISAQFSADHMRDYARANVAHATAAKDAEIARWKDAAEMQSAITKALLPYQDEAVAGRAEIEALRAEVERLQEIVRPKREEECMTLDHWRMRVYDLEANWSRCSRACAGEQDKREKAEARAERLAEALRGLKDLMLRQVKWESCDCGCPQQRTPDGPHSVTWLRAAQQVEIAIIKSNAEENEDA